MKWVRDKPQTASQEARRKNSGNNDGVSAVLLKCPTYPCRRISMSFFNEFNLCTLVYVIPFSFLCANFLRMTNENICLFLSLGVVGMLVVQV